MRQNTLRPVGRGATRTRCARSARVALRLPSCRARRELALERAVRALSLRARPIRRPRDERCEEVYHIQVQGLVQAPAVDRQPSKLVIGVSGGLDSTQALLVCAQAMDRLGLPRTEHPGLHDAGLRHQRAHARPGAAADGGGRLHRARDRHPAELPADAERHRPSVRATASRSTTSTFENVQAGERTSHLFRLANFHGALVVGTGDLSELALGWCTYGVGDHMSHYNVNASVPKTLIQHLIRWVARDRRSSGADDERRCCVDVLDDRDQPGARAGPARTASRARRTEAIVGPYELQDFHLYYTLRYGFAPPKVAFLAYTAWHDREQGAWPDMPEAAPQPVRPRRDQALPAACSCSASSSQPVQAQLHAERAEGGLGRLAVAARRLARAERRRSRRVARAGRRDPGQTCSALTEGTDRVRRKAPCTVHATTPPQTAPVPMRLQLWNGRGLRPRA